ncbi:hypothetical protein CITRIK5_80015 [Citricoccus sp. K5]|nr:hypothetical protein CITRIK5_80015 [Citricoccus sp. K5]
MQELPSSGVETSLQVNCGEGVAPWIDRAVLSGRSVLVAVGFLHLMQDSTAVRRDGRYRSGVRSEAADRCVRRSVPGR